MSSICRRRCADQRDDLAGADFKGDIVEDVRAAVGGVEAAETLSLAPALVMARRWRAPRRDRPPARGVCPHAAGALRDQLAAIEHQDAIGVAEDDVHVVFGEQHADAALARMPRVSAMRAASLRRHAGGRLVHQQQPRVVGQREGELQPLEIAIGELAAARSAGPPCRRARAMHAASSQ